MPLAVKSVLHSQPVVPAGWEAATGMESYSAFSAPDPISRSEVASLGLQGAHTECRGPRLARTSHSKSLQTRPCQHDGNSRTPATCIASAFLLQLATGSAAATVAEEAVARVHKATPGKKLCSQSLVLAEEEVVAPQSAGDGREPVLFLPHGSWSSRQQSGVWLQPKSRGGQQLAVWLAAIFAGTRQRKAQPSP